MWVVGRMLFGEFVSKSVTPFFANVTLKLYHITSDKRPTAVKYLRGAIMLVTKTLNTIHSLLPQWAGGFRI